VSEASKAPPPAAAGASPRTILRSGKLRLLFESLPFAVACRLALYFFLQRLLNRSGIRREMENEDVRYLAQKR
jgi:hypothetical protein